MRKDGQLTIVRRAQRPLAAILLVILATATANTTLFQEHYPLLLSLEMGIAVIVEAERGDLVRRE